MIVRDLSDTEVLEVAIVENIQRADLNAIEEAASYRQLMDRFGHTQEKLGEALNKSRSHIANTLRLLKLPQSVKTYVQDGALSAGHARALLTLDDPEAAARKAVERGLSVREVEAMARAPETKSAAVKPKPERAADIVALERELATALGLDVALSSKGAGGSLTVRYASLDQLDMLVRRLRGP